MNRVNFLPEGYLERKLRRRCGAIFGALLGVVIGGVAVMHLSLRISLKQLQRQHDTVQNQCEQACKTVQAIKDMQAQQQAVAQDAEMTAGVIERVPRSCILAEITRAMPRSVVLEGFSLQTRREGMTPDVEIRLNGSVISAAGLQELVVQLKRSKLFINVAGSMVQADATDNKSHRFELKMSMNPEADAARDLPQARSQTILLSVE